jgi:hypothetical protein
MGDMPRYTGLCEICGHDATCGLRRSPELTIIHCEEFSAVSVADKTISNRDGNALSNLAGSAGLGLCANCLNCATCGFPQARQGVIQCEEHLLDDPGAVLPLQAEYSKSAA